MLLPIGSLFLHIRPKLRNLTNDIGDIRGLWRTCCGYKFPNLLGKQCIVLASGRLRKLKNRELFKLLFENKLESWALRARRQLTLKGNSPRRYGVLLSALALNFADDSETLQRLSSEMGMVATGEDNPATELNQTLVKAKWEKSIDMPNLIGWRRPVGDAGLFEYKLFCRFQDVSAECFFESQVDLEYRKTWDDKVVQLEILQSDEQRFADVLHWVTKWPWPMAQREYIFLRHAKVNVEANTIILTQNSIEHPDFPSKDTKKIVRVEKYKSNWIIRAHSTFDQNGFDFILTYFDDPKGSYPSSLAKFAATRGVPDYVNNMHIAAKKYQDTYSNVRSKTIQKQITSYENSINPIQSHPIEVKA